MSKFKVKQVVSFPSAGAVGNRARKGGIITAVEKMYELNLSGIEEAMKTLSR